MERVQVDMIDMRHQPDGPYNWILLVIDHFSRFTTLYPLQTKHVAEVAGALAQWLGVFETPKYIQCDNGRDFKGVLNILLKSYGFPVINGRRRTMATHGLVEQVNGMVKTRLRQWMLSASSTRWSSGLPKVSWDMNRHVHGATRKLPAEVVFGRKPRLGWGPPANPSSRQRYGLTLVNTRIEPVYMDEVTDEELPADFENVVADSGYDDSFPLGDSIQKYTFDSDEPRMDDSGQDGRGRASDSGFYRDERSQNGYNSRTQEVHQYHDNRSPHQSHNETARYPVINSRYSDRRPHNIDPLTPGRYPDASQSQFPQIDTPSNGTARYVDPARSPYQHGETSASGATRYGEARNSEIRDSTNVDPALRSGEIYPNSNSSRDRDNSTRAPRYLDSRTPHSRDTDCDPRHNRPDLPRVDNINLDPALHPAHGPEITSATVGYGIPSDYATLSKNLDPALHFAGISTSSNRQTPEFDGRNHEYDARNRDYDDRDPRAHAEGQRYLGAYTSRRYSGPLNDVRPQYHRHRAPSGPNRELRPEPPTSFQPPSTNNNHQHTTYIDHDSNPPHRPLTPPLPHHDEKLRTSPSAVEHIVRSTIAKEVELRAAQDLQAQRDLEKQQRVIEDELQRQHDLRVELVKKVTASVSDTDGTEVREQQAVVGRVAPVDGEVAAGNEATARPVVADESAISDQVAAEEAAAGNEASAENSRGSEKAAAQESPEKPKTVGFSCSCKGICSGRCRCHKKGLPCGMACHSDGRDCGNMKSTTLTEESTTPAQANMPSQPHTVSTIPSQVNLTSYVRVESPLLVEVESPLLVEENKSSPSQNNRSSASETPTKIKEEAEEQNHRRRSKRPLVEQPETPKQGKRRKGRR
jgi:hypothetical protein